MATILPYPLRTNVDSDDGSWDDPVASNSPDASERTPPRKRGKINVNACNRCKKDKKKCDGNYSTQRACKYCLDHGEVCTYPEPGRKSRIVDQFDQLPERLHVLEKKLASLAEVMQVLASEQLYKQVKEPMFALFMDSATTTHQYELLKRLWAEFAKEPRDVRFIGESYYRFACCLKALLNAKDDLARQELWRFLEALANGDVRSLPAISASTSAPSGFLLPPSGDLPVHTSPPIGQNSSSEDRSRCRKRKSQTTTTRADPDMTACNSSASFRRLQEQQERQPFASSDFIPIHHVNAHGVQVLSEEGTSPLPSMIYMNAAGTHASSFQATAWGQSPASPSSIGTEASPGFLPNDVSAAMGMAVQGFHLLNNFMDEASSLNLNQHDAPRVEESPSSSMHLLPVVPASHDVAACSNNFSPY